MGVVGDSQDVAGVRVLFQFVNAFVVADAVDAAAIRGLDGDVVVAQVDGVPRRGLEGKGGEFPCSVGVGELHGAAGVGADDEDAVDLLPSDVVEVVVGPFGTLASRELLHGVKGGQR